MKLQNPLTFIRTHRFFHDGWNMSILAIDTVLVTVTVAWSLLHIRPSETLVPVRYTSLASFDTLGHWYELYYIAALSVIIVLANTFLAVVSYRKSRMISLFLLIVAGMCAALAVAIIMAFTAVSYGTS